MLAFLRLFLKFYFGGYATPSKCVAFEVGSEHYHILSVFLSRIQEVYSFLPTSIAIHYYKILESKKQVGEIILLRYSVFRV